MLHNSIRKNWLEVYENPLNLSCYENYYTALVLCVKHNIRFLTDVMLTQNQLSFLLDVDPRQCAIYNPDVQLEYEKIRVQKLLRLTNFTKHDFVRFVCYTLNDIISPNSGRDCPSEICSGGGGGTLRYSKYEQPSGTQCIILECDYCTYAESLDNKAIIENGGKLFPISKKDLSQYDLDIPV